MRVDTESLIAASVRDIESGELSRAETTLHRILAADPRNPVALYVLGVARMEGQNWAEAEQLFRNALSISPGQPRVCLHLARALRAQMRPREALPFCRRALDSAPGDTTILLELASAQEESGATGEAENTYRQLTEAGYCLPAVLNLARLLSQNGALDSAEDLLRKALAGPPKNSEAAGLRHALGRILKTQRRYQEALAELDAAHAMGMQIRDLTLDRANLLRHLGDHETACEIYEQWLDTHPLDTEIHRLLNELRIQSAHSDTFRFSYDTALEREPGAAALLVEKGQLLRKLQKLADAEQMFRRALHIAPGNIPAHLGLARTLEDLGAHEAAQAVYADGLALAPGHGDTVESYAGFLLRRGEIRKAATFAERAWRMKPNDQSAIALLGLCYRAQRDEREIWLNDYDKHIQVFDLPPPQGYSDMEQFNRDLADYLAGLHNNAFEYVSQTLRGGTQLHDEVFYNGHDLIDQLQPCITRAIQDYATQLCGSYDHPLVSRRRRGFRYSGSWSSRLMCKGFHTNHIHQMGWISSCYYVAVPPSVENAPDRQGWIKFGEPSPDFGDQFPARHAVEPKPGRLVLFPSYMWHGTNPFLHSAERITIAFDLLPNQ